MGKLWFEGWDSPRRFSLRDLLILHSWTLRRTKQVLEWDQRTGTPSTLDARRDHPANNPHQLRSCVKSVRNCPDQATLVRDAGRQANDILPPIKRRRFLSYITLSSFSPSPFLSLCVPLIPPPPPPPPPLPYNMMVNLLPGNLLCDVVHTSVKPKRKKRKS